jgi:Metal binding domain of Ada
MHTDKIYTLISSDGTRITSTTPGTLGGYRKERRYGRLDCKVAKRALYEGGLYAQQRVFFADEATAIAAGYRPCASCMPEEYKAWKAAARRK